MLINKHAITRTAGILKGDAVIRAEGVIMPELYKGNEREKFWKVMDWDGKVMGKEQV